LIIDECIF